MKYERYYLVFFVFIGLILILYYYNIQQQHELSVKLVDNVNNYNNVNAIQKNNININNDHNKIYGELEKYKKTNNINNYTYNIDNVDFHKDYINTDQSKLGNPNNCNFDPELEEVYNTKLSGDNNNNEIYDYSIKQNKSDLPIINPPLQLLKTDAPLRLSERHLLKI